MDGPVKVLHVVVNMNRGGAETLIMNLYRNIDRSKVQFDFLTCKEGVFDAEIMRMGGQIHRIPYVSEVGHQGFSKEVRRFLIKHPVYNIVHSHMDKMSGLILKAAKKANVSVRIAHSHNTESEGGIAVKAYKWYVGRFLKRSATHLYACSTVAAKWLFKNRSGKATIMKNGIETDKFTFCLDIREKVRKQLQVEGNALVIGHVGRFSKQKNHLFLLDTFARIKDRIPHAYLILVGDGPLRKKIMAKVKEFKLEKRVKLLGVRGDTERLLQAFDLFLFPSFHEGLPVTLIEAQGAGLPCLISDTITKEVDMGVGLIQLLPITVQYRWIEAVINSEKHVQTRRITKNELIQNGYDIKKTAQHIQRKYLSFRDDVG